MPPSHKKSDHPKIFRLKYTTKPSLPQQSHHPSRTNPLVITIKKNYIHDFPISDAIRQTMRTTDPQQGARCMRSTAVLGGRRWDRGVGIQCLLRVWYAGNGFVQFLEVAAGARCSTSWVFCVGGTPRTALCTHSCPQLCGASWTLLGHFFVNRATRNKINA